jgi:hypothetical protein
VAVQEQGSVPLRGDLDLIGGAIDTARQGEGSSGRDGAPGGQRARKDKQGEHGDTTKIHLWFSFLAVKI